MFKHYLFITLAALLFFTCSQGHYVKIKKEITVQSPLLNPNKICRDGLCVLPVWNARNNSVINSFNTKTIDSLITNAGYSKIKLISHNELSNNINIATNKKDLLLNFEKSIFEEDVFEAPVAFWDIIDKKYFLIVVLKNGSSIKMFNNEQKVNFVFNASIYSTTAKRIVWEAKATCTNTSTTNSYKTSLKGINSLIKLLPITPSALFIKERAEY